MIRAGLVSFCALLALTACGHRPPDQVTDACLILEDNRAWWRALQRSEERWGIPPGVQLAILRRESSFNAHARPARNRLTRSPFAGSPEISACKRPCLISEFANTARATSLLGVRSPTSDRLTGLDDSTSPERVRPSILTLALPCGSAPAAAR